MENFNYYLYYSCQFYAPVTVVLLWTTHNPFIIYEICSNLRLFVTQKLTGYRFWEAGPPDITSGYLKGGGYMKGGGG